MKFEKVNFNKGEFYYAGEAYDSGNGYVACGIGVMKRTSDKKIFCCNGYYDSVPAGYGFEYWPEDKYGTMSLYTRNGPVGPAMSFCYEKYLVYKTFTPEGTTKGFKIHVFYNGDYVIYEETNASEIYGVACYDGYFYFVTMDRNFRLLRKDFIKYAGPEYMFTCKRMFCMEMDQTRDIYNKTGTTSNGLRFEIGTQLLSPSSTTYWGYGAIKWSDGSQYFGEWYDNNREGIGCYIDENNNKHLGKYYKNRRYGSVLSIYNTGIVRMGNWVDGKREGISFEIHDDCVVIINYKNDSIYGNKFQVYAGSSKFSEFNSGGNVGRYFRQ